MLGEAGLGGEIGKGYGWGCWIFIVGLLGSNGGCFLDWSKGFGSDDRGGSFFLLGSLSLG